MGRATEQRSTNPSVGKQGNAVIFKNIGTEQASKLTHPSVPQHDEATANCTGSQQGGLASADAGRVAPSSRLVLNAASMA